MTRAPTRRTGQHSLRAWALLFRNQLLGFVREPVAAVFNLAVPFFIVLVQAFAYGGTAVGDQLPGYRVVDVLPVSATVIFVMIIGVFGMGVGLASMAESRTLAGFSLRPGGVPALLSAYGAVLFLLTVVGLAGAVTVLALGWGVRAPARPLLVAPAVVAGAACFLAIGASVAGATGNPRSAQGVASAVFFPLLFLSGAMFPLDAFPPALQVLARALPGYHLHELLAYTWFGSASPPWPSITYLLAGTTVVAGGAVLLFRGREDL